MIDSKDKNRSFIAITKRYRQDTANNTIQRMFANRRSKLQSNKKKESILNVTYVSPTSKLYRQNQTASLNKSKTQQINYFSLKEFFKKNLRYEHKNYGGSEKRKNIGQYFCQLSQSKQKRGGKILENKTEQLKSTIRQQLSKTNTSLTVQKVKNHAKSIDKANSIFLQRDTPIHYTQIYLFAQKKIRTQPSQEIIKKYMRNQGRQAITMSKILKFREGLFVQDPIQNKKTKNQILLNEIHPTVAIITTHQQISGGKHTQKQSFSDKKTKEQIVEPKSISLKRKEEEQISPWNRKNIPQFQYS